MKTAEEYLKVILNSYNTTEKDAELIKDYGRQCAEQALKDAADKFRMQMHQDMITSTPILTP